MTVQKIKKKDNEMRKICMIEVWGENEGEVKVRKTEDSERT